MNITASEHSALLRLASSLPKGDETRRAILSGLTLVAVEGQPDPKKKYDLYVAYGQGADEVLKKGLKPSEAARAMKTVDSVIDATGDSPSGGYWREEDLMSPKIKKLQDRLDKGAFGVKLNPNGEIFLVLKDPDDEDTAWHWTGDGWELE